MKTKKSSTTNIQSNLMSILKLSFIVTLLSMSTMVNAQVKFGPIAGINFSSITGKGSDLVATKIGFHLGGGVEIAVAKNFIIAPSVLYSLKGAQGATDSKRKLNMGYIEIPVNAKYKMESGFNIFAGPYLGLLLSAKYSDEKSNQDAKKLLTTSDFGLNLGLGFDTKSGVGFSVQYGIGISNMNNDTRVSNSNSVIGASVRCMFGAK